jgi:Sel1 repeat/Caspase domain
MSVSRGLAKIDNPEGLIVSYATQAGRTAEDGTGRHSPFTTAFLKYIEMPEEIGTIFRKISADVYTQTKQTQLPELSLSLIGEFYLHGRVDARTTPEQAAPPATSLSEAAQAWAATKDTTSQAVLEDFIRQFGNTVYASLAQARLQELKSAAESRTASSPETLVPETVPYIHDSDRAVIRNVYMSAPDHKALAISFTQIGFISGQASDEAAKAAALASCQKTTDAAGGVAVGQRCELYALGNKVVYAAGHPPLPPKPWLVRDPTIERPFAVKDVPIVNENRRAGVANCYPDVGLYFKALAISPRGSACYRNQQSTDEAIRRALETCGNAGVPCLIVAVDDKFVVPIPTTMKAIGLFRPSSDTTLAADARDEVARKLADASTGWNAVAVGANGRPGIALKAVNEQAAIDAALTDCGKHDQNCHVISIGPFLVELKSSPQPSAGSGRTGSANPLMRDVVTDCDRLASYPWDPNRPTGVSGVIFGKIDIPPALTACNQAMRQYPDVARFVYQAGRIANQQKDFVSARRFWEKAVAMGSETGMAGLGALYQYGLGVQQDYKEARRWYEKSAAMGIPGGMNGLGSLYETGAGVAKDYSEARRWYEKAAAVGEPNAMRSLGNLYQNGNGVAQDKQTARKWYEQAAAAGDDKSKDLLKTLDLGSAQSAPR